jgi:hypothetical protein
MIRKRLLTLILTLALALGVAGFTAQPAEAAGTLYIGANCYGPANCNVLFYMHGGGDNYDCVTVKLYWTYSGGSGYTPQYLCGNTGSKLVQFYVPPGRHANTAGITYNDGIGSARTECWNLS